MADTNDIPEATLRRLRELQRQQQTTIQTLMEAKGLDPRRHEVDLQTGTIQQIQQQPDE
ncbi:hypothetical protein GGP77_001680 [Salinibacter ruber]|uniref:hypothetical protein n=1 Tax=Salinibacter ruber TaxID=146919 RepID=UPI002169EE0C|nr:hypothetical protein [Salinibacter ruber]MCS3667451.1 hypothetical protein [Salinibacter ruber]